MESPIQTQGRTVASRLRKLLGFSEDIPRGSESQNAVYLHNLGPKDCCSYMSHLLGHHCNQLPWRSRQTFLDNEKMWRSLSSDSLANESSEHDKDECLGSTLPVRQNGAATATVILPDMEKHVCGLDRAINFAQTRRLWEVW